MSLDLSVNIGGVTFEHPIMNAAGHCKTVEDFAGLIRSASSGINLGSIMPAFRSGNSGEVYWTTPEFSLNSLGIPCRSKEYYIENLPRMLEVSESYKKPFVLNIAGFKTGDYVELVEMGLDLGVPIIEINFGCPNLVDAGVWKPIFSYDVRSMALILSRISRVIRLGEVISVWVKFSPYSDPYLIPQVAEMIAGFPMIQAVVTSNTFPNGFGYKDNGRPMIDPNNGFGGLSGPPLLPIGLGQVRQWRRALDELGCAGTKIVGVGGIQTGRHVRDYLRAGADLVEVGTAYFNDGERIFSRLLTELTDQLEAEETGATS